MCYDNIPFHVKIYLVGFLDIKKFMNFMILNKESKKICNEHLRIKKLEFKRKDIKKTYKNSLYKLYIEDDDPQEFIVKIVKIVHNDENYKLTFWVLSKMGRTGTYEKGYTYCVYPSWWEVKEIVYDNFIPFY
tara:strand:- start:1870 stop:2265 length:396 start_codon:yes stop_codon:yes gene_type:complete